MRAFVLGLLVGAALIGLTCKFTTQPTREQQCEHAVAQAYPDAGSARAVLVYKCLAGGAQ